MDYRSVYAVLDADLSRTLFGLTRNIDQIKSFEFTRLIS